MLKSSGYMWHFSSVSLVNIHQSRRSTFSHFSSVVEFHQNDHVVVINGRIYNLMGWYLLVYFLRKDEDKEFFKFPLILLWFKRMIFKTVDTHLEGILKGPWGGPQVSQGMQIEKSQVAMSVAFLRNSLGALVVGIHWPSPIRSNCSQSREREKNTVPKFCFFLFFSFGTLFLSHKTVTVDEEAIPLWIIVGLPQIRSSI